MCAHDRSSFSSSSSWTTPSRSTSSSELPSSEPRAPIKRNEDYGPLAKTLSPTGYEPNVLYTSDEFEVLLSFIFQGSTIDKFYYLGADYYEFAKAEIDDEHIRNALASPLSFSLNQAYHLHKKACFKVHSQF